MDPRLIIVYYRHISSHFLVRRHSRLKEARRVDRASIAKKSVRLERRSIYEQHQEHDYAVVKKLATLLAKLDRSKDRRAPFSDCTHVSGPSIELSRDNQTIERAKLSRHRFPILSSLSALPSPSFLPFSFRNQRRREKKRRRERRGAKKEEGKVAKCPREVADPRLLSLLTPAGSAFNLRSSIGLLVRREQANGPVIETPLSRPST